MMAKFEDSYVKFENLHVGDTYSIWHLLTEGEHRRFGDLVGDHSEVHTSKAFAKKAGFPDIIAYGFHVSALLSTFYSECFNSICLKQSVKFIQPVFVGETILIKGTITQISKAIKTVSIRNEISVLGKVCLTGEGVIKCVF